MSQSKFDYADLQARFREFLRSRTRECTVNDLVKRRDDATASMAGERGIMGKQSVTWGDYLMPASSWNRSSIVASYAGYRAGSSRNLAKLWNNRARSRAVRRKSRWSSRGRNSLEKWREKKRKKQGSRFPISRSTGPAEAKVADWKRGERGQIQCDSRTAATLGMVKCQGVMIQIPRLFRSYLKPLTKIPDLLARAFPFGVSRGLRTQYRGWRSETESLRV